MTIESIIDHIKNEYLRLLDSDLERYIVEKTQESEIQKFHQRFNIPLPEDFVWFHTNSDIKIVLEDGYETFDFERVSDLLERMNKRLDEGAFNGFIDNIDGAPTPLMQNVWWCKKWVPFAEDGGGNWLCLDMEPGEKGIAGQIIGFERGSGPYPTNYKSFTEFMAHQLDFTKSGGITADSDGCLS